MDFLGLVLVLSISGFGQDDFKGCAAVGSDKGGKEVSTREAAMNIRKNWDKPVADINNGMTIDSLIAAIEEADLDVNKPVEITGFVAEVKPGEKDETCNCGRDDLRDIHIKVVAKEADRSDKSKYVVVEISPRYQGQLGDYNKVKGLNLVGRWVKFTGWLTYDYKHRGNSFNVKEKTGKAIWRATAWEVHPVTKFEIVPVP